MKRITLTVGVLIAFAVFTLGFFAGRESPADRYSVQLQSNGRAMKLDKVTGKTWVWEGDDWREIATRPN